MKNRTQTPQKVSVSFLAIDKHLQDHIPSAKEKRDTSGRIIWGDGDAYPDFLLSLYESATTLHTIVNGCVDYACGDDCKLAVNGQELKIVNSSRMTPRELAEACFFSYYIYGGYALQVIRSLSGDIQELVPLDMRFIRTDKDGETVYYCEETNRYSRRSAVVYPRFNGLREQGVSVLVVKNTTTQTYPQPLYVAAVKSCEIERNVDDYHLNSLDNGFMGSHIINFCNGIPSEEQQAEIEKDINEKFTGHHNAGRVVLNFASSKDSAAFIEKLETEDFGEKYKSLATHSRQQIFASFRANPNLFGIATESSGFNTEEYESAFKLFNRTMIRPAQRKFCDVIQKIYDGAAVFNIAPFSLEDNTITDQNVQ